MTMLVTGATGLLGSHVVDLLVEQGARPRVLIHPDEARIFTRNDVDVHVGDVRDAAAVAMAVDGVECVLHCAARTGPWGVYDEYVATNVRALETIVRSATTAGVQRLVHVSSITVHGNDVHGAADETSPFRAERNPYSRTKIAGERLLDRLAPEELGVTIVRPGWIYGPRDAASFGRFATMIRDGRMVVIGSGANALPLVYVMDVARGVVMAARHDAARGRAYVLVNDEPVTQREYLDAIADALGVAHPTRRIPYRLALLAGAGAETTWRALHRTSAPPIMRYGVQMLGGDNRFSIARARAELGFSPEVSMREGVERGIAWYRAMQADQFAAGSR